jgi:hypothetical protein
MRAGDAKECEDAGIHPRKAVWRSFRHSLMCQTAFLDGDLAAIFGMGGSYFSKVGEPWMFTTPVVERDPVSFLILGKQWVDEMLAITPRLENFVSADYPKACRFLQAIGFHLGEPEPFGLHGKPFRKFWMEAK